MTSWRLRGPRAKHSHDRPILARASEGSLAAHVDIDGIWYQSRLTGGDCLAIFDRALENLTLTNTGDLEGHPELPKVLRMHRVRIER